MAGEEPRESVAKASQDRGLSMTHQTPRQEVSSEASQQGVQPVFHDQQMRRNAEEEEGPVERIPCSYLRIGE